jgi:hypothetical protein
LPSAISVNAIALTGSHIYAGLNGAGVYSSDNNGQSWVPLNNYLLNTWINSILAKGPDIFAGTGGGGIYRTDTNAAFWVRVNNGLKNARVETLVSDGSHLFAGTWGGGLFISTNYGSSWDNESNGIVNPYITEIALMGGTIFAGTAGTGVYRSTNMGSSWVPVNTGLMDLYIISLMVKDSLLYAATFGGIYHSADLGNTWTLCSTGPTAQTITSLAANDTILFAGTSEHGIYLSQDDGNTWVTANNGLTSTAVLALSISNNRMFAGTNDGSFISGDNGGHWEPVSNDLTGYPVNSFTGFGTSVFEGSRIRGVSFATDPAGTWESLNAGLNDTSVLSQATDQVYLYAGTSGSGVWRRSFQDIFTIISEPDTLVLAQFAGSSDTLHITTSVSWMIIGAMPDWLTCDKLSGNGSGYIVFQTTKPNMGIWKMYASFFLYSRFAPTVTLTVAQKERSAGMDKNPGNFLEINSDPFSGRIRIESGRPVESVKIYDMSGKRIVSRKTISDKTVITLPETCRGVFILRIEGRTWEAERKIIRY